MNYVLRKLISAYILHNSPKADSTADGLYLQLTGYSSFVSYSTDYLTPWSRVTLEKPIIPQAVNMFTVF
jgi:hypothetical protein